MTPLLALFLTEGKELLQGIGEKLMGLEREPNDSAVMAELFRMVHTLKGNSGLFDFPELTRVLHASEDLMDKVRSGRIPFTQDLADHLLDAMDFVVLLCDEIAATEKVDPSHASDAAVLVLGLRALTPEEADSSPRPPAAPPTTPDRGPQTWEHLPDDVRDRARQLAREGRALSLVTYVPSQESYFQGIDPFHSARKTPGVIWGRVVPRGSWPPLAELDAYRCTLDFEILTTASPGELNSHFRYVLDQVKITPVYPEDPGLPPSLAAIFDAQRRILLLDDQAPWKAGRYQAVAAVLTNCCRSLGDVAGPDQIAAALHKVLETGTATALLVWLDVKQGRVVPVAVVAVPGGAPGEAPKFGRRAEDSTLDLKSIRVDQEKIDALMNLIGEMVVSKNALPYLAQRAETHFGQRELAREIKTQYAAIDRIATELQDAILQVRMLPMSFVFQRFPRLVREISRKLGKQVTLVLEGEDTEADKNIIASLSDPLMHIVRNSLDHGIETPEVRRACGKPETGTLTLRASQEADRAVIEVTDDGKGIDPAVIKRKAVENGLVTQAIADQLDDRAAANLAFAAGLSTAQVVSDLSGRGVGMDVVKSAVEKMSGTVSLESVVGRGTTLRISLPLTMAMAQVMVIESDHQLFGVPMDQVIETVRLPRASVRKIKHSLTTVLRGRVLPLTSLNTLLGIPVPVRPNAFDEWAVLVSQVKGELVGILVDQFHRTTDVIQKPLEGVLAHLPAYSGSALMGDGSVLMVLNLAEVL